MGRTRVFGRKPSRTAQACVPLLLILLLLGGCGSASVSTSTTVTEPTTTLAPGPPPSALAEKALQLVNLMAAGSFGQVVASFDQTMSKGLPVDKLAEVWQALEKQVGPYVEPVTTTMEMSGEYRVVTLVGRFAQAAIDIRIVFDTEEKVAGLFFKPSETAYVPPAYVDDDAFSESEVTVQSGEYQLPGTLTLPLGAGPFPAVVLVHGSGANDRDETFGPNKPFRDIAQGLATAGIAVLRYDKRTLVYQEVGAAPDLTVNEETVEDALAAFALLQGAESVDPARTFLLGHSLGATLLPRMAAQASGAAGFVLLAAAARPLEDLVLEQNRYLLSLESDPGPEEQALLAELEAQVQRVKDPALSPDTPAAELPLGLPATYWLDLRGYEPATVAKAIDKPMLVAQGGRDYQVTEQDYELWRRALSGRADVVFAFYPELNHLFMAGEEKSRPAEYLVEGHVAPEVVNDIARFILGAAR